jgi:holin-like protein
MLVHLLVLLAFQFIGEVLHRCLHIPLSGPLIGMTLLLLALVIRGGTSEAFQETTRPLLATLALLFVPAGVGLVNHLDLLELYWLPIVAASVLGAVASLAVTAVTLKAVESGLDRRRRRQSLAIDPASEAVTTGERT